MINLKTVSKSYIGSTHAKSGLPCDDFCVTYCGDLTIAVLCDGASSKKQGGESAQFVCNTTLEYFKSFKAPVHSFSAEKFSQYINDALDNEDFTERNSGTTLLFVVSDGKNCLYGHIGDGVIIKGDSNGFKVCSEPENGFLVNMTYFFPCTDSTNHFRTKLEKISGPFCFILASDGASDLLYDPETLTGHNACNMLEEWTRQFSEAECEKILEDNLKNVFSKYSSDDMSIAIMIK